VSARAPLHTVSTVDALVAALRRRILDGDLSAGARLPEQELTAAYGVARHTVRAALRALAHEGLIRIEPHRGARVAAPAPEDLRGLGELRTALEVEAARLALARHGGRLPEEVHAAARALRAAAAEAAGFAAVSEAHEALHHAVVRAGRSPRLTAAHAGLGGEVRLFLVQLRPAWDLGAVADEHDRLLTDLEGQAGPEALRAHIAASTDALVAHLDSSG